MSGSQYLSRKEIDQQYRPKGYGLSPGLQRARAPYRTRNALTGILIGAFAVGVWAYSIRAVKQDSFEDVDAEARTLLEARARDEAANAVSVSAPTGTGTVATSTAATSVSESIHVISTPEGNTSSQSSNIASSSLAFTPTSVVAEPETFIRGVLASRLNRLYPHLLDPVNGTFVWGAPPVDRVGKIGDSSDSDSGTIRRT